MAKCNNCGADLTGRFCTNCGLEAVNPIPDPEIKSTYQNPQPQIPNPYVNPAPPQTTVAGWLGWLALITYLPIIGIIIALVAPKDENVKNFSKAYLILMAIAFVLSLIIWIAFAAVIAGLADSINY